MDTINEYPHLKFFADDANSLFDKICAEFGIGENKRCIHPYLYQYHSRAVYCTYAMAFDDIPDLFTVPDVDEDDNCVQDNTENLSRLNALLDAHDGGCVEINGIEETQNDRVIIKASVHLPYDSEGIAI